MDNLRETRIMSRFELDAHSFIVRIWQEHQQETSAPGIWRGWVKHVQSEQIFYFAKTADVGHILDRYLLDIDTQDTVFEPLQQDISK